MYYQDVVSVLYIMYYQDNLRLLEQYVLYIMYYQDAVSVLEQYVLYIMYYQDAVSVLEEESLRFEHSNLQFQSTSTIREK